MEKQVNSDIVAKLSEYFSKRNDVAFAFLYGSYARGMNHKNSDVDIAVYFFPEKRYPTQYEENVFYDSEDEIASDLDRLLGKEVELLVLNRAASVICASAARGVRLDVKDWPLYFDFVEIVSRDAEDLMTMRLTDFLERCTA